MIDMRRNQRSSRNDPIVARLRAESPLGVKGGGRAAVEFAAAGKSAVMRAIRRISDAPYCWDIIDASLSEVANQERLLPAEFISADGFGITAAARRYLAPLIVGEAYPPFNGLHDSPLEGDGFELLVPRRESPRFSEASRRDYGADSLSRSHC